MGKAETERAMVTSTLSERWQTTIPREVREALGLKPGQDLEYVIRGGVVTLRPGSTRDLAGSLKSDIPAGTKRQEREAAQEHVVARYLKRKA
jgi:AbrB family looped-hinge helix DNA binding protein